MEILTSQRSQILPLAAKLFHTNTIFRPCDIILLLTREKKSLISNLLHMMLTYAFLQYPNNELHKVTLAAPLKNATKVRLVKNSLKSRFR